MTDRLDICQKCGCDACYVQLINETKYSYSCLGCGFYTSDMLVNGEFDREAYESEFPELYRDIVHVDSDNRCWYPQTVTTEDGTLFINGFDKDNWKWSVIKKKPLTEEERSLPRYKDQTHKSDPKTLMSFEKDFIEALDYLGVFNKQ